MDKSTAEKMVTDLIFAYQRFYTTPTHESNTVVENYVDAQQKIIEALTHPPVVEAKPQGSARLLEAAKAVIYWYYNDGRAEKMVATMKELTASIAAIEAQWKATGTENKP